MAKRTRITIETDSLWVLRGRRLLPAWCPQCGAEAEMIPLLEGMSAMRRPCTCEEIARAAVFMLTEDASAMTGQNLVVDAGLTT